MTPPQRLADESLALAQAQQDASRASLLPQLGVSASQLRQTTNPATLGFNFPGLPKLIGPYSVFDARIKASQKLIDFAAAAELTGDEFGARAAAAQADASREATASRAPHAYLHVLGNEPMQPSSQADLGIARK